VQNLLQIPWGLHLDKGHSRLRVVLSKCLTRDAEGTENTVQEKTAKGFRLCFCFGSTGV
jgi:hypothetical protein